MCDVPNRNTVTQFFLAFLASIMQISPAREWKVHEDNGSIIAHM